MRRSEKEIQDRDVIDELIHHAGVMRLAMCDGVKPYIVPLCYGYDGTFLYFHCARKGMKIDYLKKNPNVCFEIEDGVELVPHDTLACKFTYKYRSVIGFGEVSEIEDVSEKQAAFHHIMSQYSGKKWNIPKMMMGAVSVWKIRVDSLSGKQSK